MWSAAPDPKWSLPPQVPEAMQTTSGLEHAVSVTRTCIQGSASEPGLNAADRPALCFVAPGTFSHLYASAGAPF